MLYFYLVVGSYAIGAIPFGVLIAKARGIDLLSVGSGNVGATNVVRALGWKLGVFVFILDILKGALPAYVAGRFSETAEYAVLFGAIAVAGHTLSPFLKFRGGKGVATSLGVLYGTSWIVGVYGFGVFLVFFALTRIVSLSSLIGSIAVLVSAYFTKQNWMFFAVYVPLVTFVFIRHKGNIQRLLKGEEPKLTINRRPDDAESR